MKSLQEIADKATEAALIADQEPFTIHDRQGQRYFTLASELRLAFAQSVMEQIREDIQPKWDDLCKQLKESRQQTESAWFNRDHFCEHINIIGHEVLGFTGDNCAPDAVSREIKKLVARLKASPWIPCAERMPTREDADHREEVLWLYPNGQPMPLPYDCPAADAADGATHWMRIPPLPAQEPATPQPPPDYHYATEEERKCLPVGSLIWLKLGGSRWRPSSNIGAEAAHELHFYACPDHPQLVTFDASGKLLPPPFGEWHRQDWEPEMLEGGWRPLLNGEPCVDGDEVLVEGTWSHGIDTGFPMSRGHLQTRTRRPLPAPPKEPEWVPLSKEDFDSGLWQVSRNPLHSVHLVTRVHYAGILIDSGGCKPSLWEAGFSELMHSEYQRRNLLDAGSTWQLCRKLKQEGAV